MSSTSRVQASPPAAWYPDVQRPGQLRWFDGEQWTDHWSPMLPAGTWTGPDRIAHWLIPVGRSWQSIVAGYLGLLSVVVLFLGPFAVGFGVWGLHVARSANGHGRGRCWFGIVAGIWGMVVLGLLIAFA